MKKQGMLYPKDFLAIMVIVVGATGFLLWGIGLSSIGNETIVWLGELVVGVVIVIATFLSRWLR